MSSGGDCLALVVLRAQPEGSAITASLWDPSSCSPLAGSTTHCTPRLTAKAFPCCCCCCCCLQHHVSLLCLCACSQPAGLPVHNKCWGPARCCTLPCQHLQRRPQEAAHLLALSCRLHHQWHDGTHRHHCVWWEYPRYI